MTARPEDTAERNERLAEMEVQLDAWSSRLEQLVVEALEGGAPPDDPTRVRLGELRARLDALRDRSATLDATIGLCRRELPEPMWWRWRRWGNLRSW